MNLEKLTKDLVNHCLNIGFCFPSGNEVSQYLVDDLDYAETNCEGILHEMCHMFLLYGIEVLNNHWTQYMMDSALENLSLEEQDENEIETTALTVMIARELGCENMESISRGNVRGNLVTDCRDQSIDDLLDPYLLSSNRSNYNTFISFINNL